MYFLTDSLLQHVLDQYDSLNLDKEHGDEFFNIFGPGNLTKAKDRPHERFGDYENLLKSLQDRDKQKYKKIHKGTPFFFLSWLAFDLRNYEKALYYLDASILEDEKNADPVGRKSLPSYNFLILSEDYERIPQRVVKEIREKLQNQLERFNKISNLSPIDIDNFILKFTKPLINDVSSRTIITAFYVFLMEYNERSIELSLKSTKGSSMGPIILHLFSGALIFESLLKKLYPQKDDGIQATTLGDILINTSNFGTDFSFVYDSNNDSLRASSLEVIVSGINDNSLKTAFLTTAKIRNTTGHNLVWDNVFNEIENYDLLVNQIINALFFVIETKFIR
jgi:hypothetical protein